jgi:hypothetical protein
MKVFIAIKFKEGQDSETVPVLKETIKAAGHEPYAFVDEGYIDNEKEMMSRASAMLDKCDLMVVEASWESFGVGIQTGYFYSQKKPIITVFRKDAKIAGTLKGISTACVEYTDFTELREKLSAALVNFKT